MADSIAIEIAVPIWDKRLALSVFQGSQTGPTSANVVAAAMPSGIGAFPDHYRRARLDAYQGIQLSPLGANAVVALMSATSAAFDLPLVYKGRRVDYTGTQAGPTPANVVIVDSVLKDTLWFDNPLRGKFQPQFYAGWAGSPSPANVVNTVHQFLPLLGVGS